jgi:spore coat polysaccharide biosynthesis protein SpsF
MTTGSGKQQNTSASVAVFIQARMGSTRLPGKALLPLFDKTILEHVVTRLKKSKLLELIVLLTSVAERDELLVKEAQRLEIPVFRGSEDDVLDRYYQASKRFPAKHIVRVTADCPLIDAALVDELVRGHVDSQADYAKFEEDSVPRGVSAEVFTKEALEQAASQATQQYEREHVTPFFYLNPTHFKLLITRPERVVLRRPNLRLTLDTKEDFTLIQEVYKKLYPEKNANFDTCDAIQFLDANNHLLKLNEHVQQKSIFQ